MKKIIIFLMFILIMGCSSCFAASDYGFTIEFIEQCIENYSDNIKSYVEQYNCKNYIVMASDKSSISIRLTDGTFSLGSYVTSSSGKQGYCWFNKDGSWLNNFGSFGTGRPGYSSKNDYIFASSQEEISSVRINSLDILMGLVESEPEEPEIILFDGVFTGNEYKMPYTSNFTLNDTMLRFDYTAYTDLNNSNVTNYFYLQEFLPEIAVNITEKDLNFTEIDLFIIQNNKIECNFSFDYLRRRMKDGYIYRLYCFSNQNNESGNFLRVTDSTSCFFSLNSWESNAIKVINLNDYLGTSSGNIIPLPDGSGDSSGDISDKNEFDIKDGFENINDSINNLNNNINNTILGTPNESGEREGGLVGNLLSGLWEGLVSLIIPTNEQFGQWITETYESVNSRGGVLLYSKEFWISLLALINNEETGDLIFEFPVFKLPTSDVVIWEGISFNVNEFIEKHEALNTFYITYIIIVSGIAIYYFCQYLWSLWQSLINGTGSVEISQNEEIDGWSVGQYGNVKMPHYKTKRNIKFK